MKYKQAILLITLVLTVKCSGATTIDSLYKIMRAPITVSEKIKALISSAVRLQFQDRVVSIEMTRRAVLLSRSIADAELEVRSLHNLGNFLIGAENQDSARLVIQQGLDLAKKNHFEKFVARLLNNMGVTWSKQNEVGKAIVYYMESTNYDRKDTARLATSYINISGIFLSMQQYQKSLEYARKGTDFALAAKDSSTIALSYTQIGTVYRRLDKIRESDTYYEKALAYGKTMRDNYYRMLVYQNYAVTLNMQKRVKEAEAYADTALTLGIADGNPGCIAYGYSMKGVIAFEKKDYKAARELYIKAEELLKEGESDWNAKMEVYSNRSKLENELGNSAQAYSYLQKYTSIKDSSIKAESARTVEFLEAQYQFEAKQKEILQLQKDKLLQSVSLSQKNTINYLLISALVIVMAAMLLGYFNYKQKQLLQRKMIMQMETDQELLATRMVLHGQEEERRRLARDLHDGLGGMLSGVKHSFQRSRDKLEMQNNEWQPFDRSVEMLDASISELRRIAHDLGPESLLKYGISAAIKDYCTNINKSEAVAITYQPLQQEPVKMDQSKSGIVYRIVQELLNNVLKHSGARTAIVQLSQEMGRLSVTVEDDGKGIDLDNLKKSSGMGWNNIRSRIEYLKGSLDVKSDPGKGTYVHFTVNI